MIETKARPMFKKTLRRASLLLPAVLLAYLAVVAAWSAASVDTLIHDNPVPADAARLSASQSAILLRIEDPTFFTHPGLSVGRGQGFATITSAVARDLFLSEGRLGGVRGALQSFYRGVFACCKKIDLGRDVMALVLNAHLSKQAQLSAYVARVYMGTDQGRQLRGLEQASRSYLAKPLGALTDQEFAALVAMIKAPNTFHPRRNRAAYDVRVAGVRSLIAGKCQASGWFDTALGHCDP